MISNKNTLRLLVAFFILISISACKNDKSEPNPPEPPTPPVEQDTVIRGADLSFVPEIETYNLDFYDTAGNVKDIVTILKDAGCNTVRLRLWHTPADGHSGLAEVSTFAERIKAAGMKVYLTVHYSDTWADPGKQTPPAVWQSLSLAGLKDSVYQYTNMVVARIRPDYISLGNEINAGILWNLGRITNGDNLYQLLERASAATRSADSSSKIIIHYAGLNGAEWFFNQMKDHNMDYDIMGISYYPFWHGKNFDSVMTALDQLSLEFGKPLLIAETSYPFTLGWADWTNNVIGLEDQLIPAYPATPEGQLAFMTALRVDVEAMSDGLGFCYWGGDYVAFKGDHATDGSSWENMALFDFDLHALPAMKVFAK